MRRIGLIGGMSPESTSLYYQLLNKAARKKLGGRHSAWLLLCSVDFAEIDELGKAGRWDEAGRLIAEAATGLERAGAEAIVICANAIHRVAPRVLGVISVPLISLIQTTIDEAKRLGVTRVGLIGTRFSMTDPFLAESPRKAGLEIIVPEAEDIDRIDSIIFDELCEGVVNEDSRSYLLDIIEDLEKRGAQAVILGCTELSMIVSDEDAGVPLLDTTRIHVDAVAKYMLSPR